MRHQIPILLAVLDRSARSMEEGTSNSDLKLQNFSESVGLYQSISEYRPESIRVYQSSNSLRIGRVVFPSIRWRPMKRSPPWSTRSLKERIAQTGSDGRDSHRNREVLSMQNERGAQSAEVGKIPVSLGKLVLKRMVVGRELEKGRKHWDSKPPLLY